MKRTPAARIERIRWAHGAGIANGKDVGELLAAIDHVVETLREAQRNNGGYGFVRGLLEYLGATEEVPA